LNVFWNLVSSFISGPSDAQKACHSPKPILLNTGYIKFPSPWSPSVLPIQLFQIGNLFIVGFPGELTTMAGRRLKETLKTVLLNNGAPKDLIIVISGLSNAYSQYTTTNEEYLIQRYEGASTLYGPWQLAAYQQEYAKLALSLIKNSTIDPGTLPTDWSSSLPSLQPGVIFDDGPVGKIRTDTQKQYRRGETARCQFYTGNPRNNYRTEGTFLAVEQRLPDGRFQVIATDSDWETKYMWKRIPSILLGESMATIEWDIPLNQPTGTYRLVHFGDKRNLWGTVTSFNASSSLFQVV